EMVCEESFGPLAPILPVRDLDDAIALANASDFGLSSGVVTNDMAAAIRVVKELKTGAVNVNQVPGFRMECSPFGGVKDSGLGIKEGVIEAMKFMTTTKTFSLPW
ncbi:MAG TPA: aldehyde dehydrogenase family protein, partial [Verrucomicrobiota bacterium]|nr:aldehyde dehydrogenase family protein [Verrucomicrobiota bacterium]